MKSFIAVGALLGLAVAQISFNNVTDVFTCSPGGGAYCAGGSIIIRCTGTVGQPGNCNDNLAGYPPIGGFANCTQTSTSSGDAVCCKGDYCEQPIPLSGSNSTTTTTVTTSSTTSVPFGNTTIVTSTSTTTGGTTGGSTSTSTGTVTSTITGGAIGGSTVTGIVTSTAFASTTAGASTTTGIVTVISDGQPQASSPASSLVSPYSGNGAAATQLAGGVVGAAAVVLGALLV